MPPATRRSSRTTAPRARPKADARSVVAWLEAHGNQRYRDGMVRYALPTERAFGIPVGTMRKYAKGLGQDHDLALALWETGWYEARMVAAFVDDPAQVTPAQMDRWCGDFDNWGICDTVCFHLFDRTPHAFAKVSKWAGRREEFVRRGAFALLASLAAHDKSAKDSAFIQCLPLIGRAADDERNFVKKGVLWALRLIGERSPALHAKSVALARRLAESPAAAARWVGKSALRELASPAARRRLASKRRGAAG